MVFLQFLRLVIENAKPFANIVCHFPACNANDRCVTDGAFLEYRKVCRPATDIKQSDADFFLFIIKHSVA